jgi:predicted RNA binding protein YcfA (HicA-like mRNA interferase family)
MSRLPVLRPRQVIAALERAGFYIHHQRGSHARLLHRSNTALHVTVPMHSRDIPPSLLQYRILKQAGITVEQFLRLL